MFKFTIEMQTQNAVCARCNKDFGFPDDGEIHYCYNEYTCNP